MFDALELLIAEAVVVDVSVVVVVATFLVTSSVTSTITVTGTSTMYVGAGVGVITHPIGVVVCVGVGVVAQVDFATSVSCSENCFVGLNQNRGGVVLGAEALLKALLLTLPYAGVGVGVVVAFSIDDFGDSDVVIVLVI